MIESASGWERATTVIDRVCSLSGYPGVSPLNKYKDDGATSGSVICFWIRMGGEERSEPPPGSYYQDKVGCGLALLMPNLL